MQHTAIVKAELQHHLQHRWPDCWLAALTVHQGHLEGRGGVWSEAWGHNAISCQRPAI